MNSSTLASSENNTIITLNPIDQETEANKEVEANAEKDQALETLQVKYDYMIKDKNGMIKNRNSQIISLEDENQILKKRLAEYEEEKQ